MWIKYIALILVVVGTVSCLPSGRIVNGTDSKISKYPFMVSLRWQGQHMCGGSIISPRWLLTAAHCLYGFNVSELSMQYGITDVAPDGPHVIYPKRVIMHWGYEPSNNYPNDIALIELSGTLTYNYKTIAPVQLPDENFEIEQFFEGQPGVVAGWGLNATNGVPQKTLQEANVKIFSFDECKELLKTPINDDHICAGAIHEGRGGCSSDSGGPLIYKGSIQLGVVSWGEGACGSKPVAFAKVSHYIDWIKRHIY